MGIYSKLIEIQKAIHGLQVDSLVNGYRYLSGNKLLKAVRPLMDLHGVLLKMEVLSIENTRQNYEVSGGRTKSEMFTSVNFRFTWVDTEDGSTDVNMWAANGMNGWDKGFGSAATYGERYFLMKFFHLITDEDDVDRVTNETGTPTPEKKIISTNHPKFEAILGKIKGGTPLDEIIKVITSAGHELDAGAFAALKNLANGN